MRTAVQSYVSRQTIDYRFTGQATKFLFYRLVDLLYTYCSLLDLPRLIRALAFNTAYPAFTNKAG